MTGHLLKNVALYLFYCYFAIRYCSNSVELLLDLVAKRQFIYKIDGVVINTHPGNIRTALVLYESFISKVYERQYKLSKNNTVVDIGASIGEFALYAASLGCSVVAVEPEPNNFALLTQNCKTNNIKIKIVKAAVSSKKGTSKLYLSQIPEGNSLYNTNRNEKWTNNISVNLITLKDLLGSSSVDLLKIDAEGAEGEIICKADSKTLQLARHIAAEYHSNSSPATLKEITKKLNDAGFLVKFFETRGGYGYIYATQM